MSILPGNPFADEMNYHADPRNSLEAHATLALAYEQRTANMIAYIETFGGGIDYDDIWHDISARLGLDK